MQLESLEDNARMSSEAKTKSKESAVNVSNDEKILMKKILNAGNYCARKFASRKQENKKYFIRYCNRKINQVMMNQLLPNLQSCETIKETLEIFENIYPNSDQDLAKKIVDNTGGHQSPSVSMYEHKCPVTDNQDFAKEYQQQILEDQCRGNNEGEL